jgi:hypothetical protein
MKQNRYRIKNNYKTDGGEPEAPEKKGIIRTKVIRVQTGYVIVEASMTEGRLSVHIEKAGKIIEEIKISLYINNRSVRTFMLLAECGWEFDNPPLGSYIIFINAVPVLQFTVLR